MRAQRSADSLPVYVLWPACMSSDTPRRASQVYLPPGPWTSVYAALCERFPRISSVVWHERMSRGDVRDTEGRPLAPDHPYLPGKHVFYYREVQSEGALPATEVLVHVDEHLIVVDKPHFLPVMPAGEFVEETLLARLCKKFGTLEIAPLHRIDRLTAGLVLFSRLASSRARYHQLFASHRIEKCYEAVAPALRGESFPLRRCSRIAPGTPFFRMQEEPGPANAEVNIDVLASLGDYYHYQLRPKTGKKHQLRVQMSALGAAICNDPYYPELRDQGPDQLDKPLQLLARSLAFVDPLRRCEMRFESRLQLRMAQAQ